MCFQVPDIKNIFQLLEENIAELEMDSPLDEAITQAPSLKAFKELLEQNNGRSRIEVVTY